MKIQHLHTKRLLLREWKESDIEPFIAMGRDERVMEYFPKLMSEENSRQFIAEKQSIVDERGWGLWAVEELQSKDLLAL